MTGANQSTGQLKGLLAGTGVASASLPDDQAKIGDSVNPSLCLANYSQDQANPSALPVN
jgi:hypothetical protein